MAPDIAIILGISTLTPNIIVSTFLDDSKVLFKDTLAEGNLKNVSRLPL